MKQLTITQQITNRESYSFDKYLQEVGKIDMLTADEEVKLAQEIKNGSMEALDRLVKCNLRFVISVAKQYQNQGVPLTDLINEGNVGLIKAAEKFDATKGFKFISYAVWWIRQTILKSIEEHAKIVRLPSNKVTVLNKVKKALAKLEQEYEREPSSDELGQVLGMHADEVTEFISYNTKAVSIDKPIDDDEDRTLVNVLESTDGEGADNNLMDESLKQELQRMLCRLSKREERIICMYYGLDGSKYQSLEEIGNHLELSKERVRQIKDKALRKMRMSARKTALKSYL
ncbi:MAG: RNA polymerase sigma factor RpoD/SigA [Bacteroidetes bacterium]|nr:RNA polymerase sigma factor RpoD/SigA [Bacteroidota bacterium]